MKFNDIQVNSITRILVIEFLVIEFHYYSRN